MIKELLLSIFQLILTSIYVSHRKDTVIEYSEDGSVYNYTARMGEHLGEQRTLNFFSKRIKHTVKYGRWLMPNRVVYTYHVDLLEYHGENIVRKDFKVFPQLCGAILNNTPYPHLCAINAYIDTYQYW